jgi:hypothetical protein
MYESTPHFLWRSFLKRIFEIGQCQSIVINNDNTNNGRYENNHFRFRPVVLKPKKTLNPFEIPHLINSTIKIDKTTDGEK